MGVSRRLSAPQSVLADCTATESVGDPVYISAPKAGGRWQVRQADPADDAKMPAIGFVSSKPSATTCYVQVAGDLDGFAGLTAGQPVFAAFGGVEQPPIAYPLAGIKSVQRLGIAVSSDTVHVNPESHRTRIRPE